MTTISQIHNYLLQQYGGDQVKHTKMSYGYYFEIFEDGELKMSGNITYEQMEGVIDGFSNPNSELVELQPDGLDGQCHCGDNKCDGCEECEED